MPAPPPPPPPPSGGNKSQSSGGRGALLADIQKGRKLKKATTNDRSAPAIEGETCNFCAGSGKRRFTETWMSLTIRYNIN